MAEIAVGQEVAIQHSGSMTGPRFSMGYRITKIAPKGRITVTNGRGTVYRFHAAGGEVGAGIGAHYHNYLRFDLNEVARIQEQQNSTKVAMEAIRNIAPGNLCRDKESLRKIVADLQANIDAARAAVEAIKE